MSCGVRGPTASNVGRNGCCRAWLAFEWRCVAASAFARVSKASLRSRWSGCKATAVGSGIAGSPSNWVRRAAPESWRSGRRTRRKTRFAVVARPADVLASWCGAGDSRCWASLALNASLAERMSEVSCSGVSLGSGAGAPAGTGGLDSIVMTMRSGRERRRGLSRPLRLPPAQH